MQGILPKSVKPPGFALFLLFKSINQKRINKKILSVEITGAFEWTDKTWMQERPKLLPARSGRSIIKSYGRLICCMPPDRRRVTVVLQCGAPAAHPISLESAHCTMTWPATSVAVATCPAVDVAERPSAPSFAWVSRPSAVSLRALPLPAGWSRMKCSWWIPSVTTGKLPALWLFQSVLVKN